MYEVQWWLLMIGSVLSAISLSSLGAAVFYVVWYGILIGSLYGSSNTVRRFHIAMNSLFSAAAVLALARVDETRARGGAVLAVLLMLAWAIYWYKSKRARNAYPPRAS